METRSRILRKRYWDLQLFLLSEYLDGFGNGRYSCRLCSASDLSRRGILNHFRYRHREVFEEVRRKALLNLVLRYKYVPLSDFRSTEIKIAKKIAETREDIGFVELVIGEGAHRKIRPVLYHTSYLEQIKAD